MIKALLTALMMCLCLGGVASASGVRPAVTGGKPAVANQYPFLVDLEQGPRGQAKGFCSGSLIAPRYVLTAAHCLALSDGESDQQLPNTGLRATFKNMPGSPAIPAVRTAYWKDFNPYLMAKKAQADIALLELKTDAPVAPVALAADSSIGKGKQLTILGYGQKEEGRESRRLIVGKTRAEEQSRCGYQEELQAYPEGEICTSSRPRGKRAPLIGAGCQGDSGGALLYRGQLVGVTSWSLEDNCERPKKKRSTVFARADFAKQWLLQQTGLPLFGEPAVEKRTEFPEAGGAWIEEASWSEFKVGMSTIQGAADRIAKQEIDLTRLEAQNYYRERQSLQNFTPYLGKAETRIETDGQKAEITYPGEAGACKVIIEKSYLWQGSPAIRCPGGDWQAGVALVLLVDLKSGETEEEVLEGNASSDKPWSQIDIPAQMTREAKKIEARAYIRFYNQLGNGSSALSDSVQIASPQAR